MTLNRLLTSLMQVLIGVPALLVIRLVILDIKSSLQNKGENKNA